MSERWLSVEEIAEYLEKHRPLPGMHCIYALKALPRAPVVSPYDELFSGNSKPTFSTARPSGLAQLFSIATISPRPNFVLMHNIGVMHEIPITPIPAQARNT